MGKGGGSGGDSSARGGSEEKPLKWIKISGKYYDVTNFRHPGGNIIDLFQNMVRREKKRGGAACFFPFGRQPSALSFHRSAPHLFLSLSLSLALALALALALF